MVPKPIANAVAVGACRVRRSSVVALQLARLAIVTTVVFFATIASFAFPVSTAGALAVVVDEVARDRAVSIAERRGTLFLQVAAFSGPLRFAYTAAPVRSQRIVDGVAVAVVPVRSFASVAEERIVATVLPDAQLAGRRDLTNALVVAVAGGGACRTHERASALQDACGVVVSEVVARAGCGLAGA